MRGVDCTFIFFKRINLCVKFITNLFVFHQTIFHFSCQTGESPPWACVCVLCVDDERWKISSHFSFFFPKARQIFLTHPATSDRSNTCHKSFHLIIKIPNLISSPNLSKRWQHCSQNASPVDGRENLPQARNEIKLRFFPLPHRPHFSFDGFSGRVCLWIWCWWLNVCVMTLHGWCFLNLLAAVFAKRPHYTCHHSERALLLGKWFGKWESALNSPLSLSVLAVSNGRR